MRINSIGNNRAVFSLTDMHCCSKSNKSKCREACSDVLQKATTLQEMLDGLELGGCGAPLLQVGIIVPSPLNSHHNPICFNFEIAPTGAVLAVLFETVIGSGFESKRGVSYRIGWSGFREMALLSEYFQQHAVQESLFENFHQRLVHHVGGVPSQMSQQNQRGRTEKLFGWR